MPAGAQSELSMKSNPPRVLPSRELWIHSGDMKRTLIVTDSTAVHTRFAVLTNDMMLFTKHFDDKTVFVQNSLEGLVSSNGQALTEKRLRKMFQAIDKDSSGCSSFAVRVSVK